MPISLINDINIYYEVYGEGEPLLLIMGYGANSRWWTPQVTDLSREYKLVIFDNRGTGKSDKPDVCYTLDTMADDAAGLLDEIGVKAAHVFGVSMGGMIAQQFALNFPEKVVSLILGCTMPGGRNAVLAGQDAIAVLFDHEQREKLTLEQQAKKLLPFLFTQGYIDQNSEFIDALIGEMIENPTPLCGYRRQAEAIMGFDTYDRLPEIKAPTLVIAGTEDRLIPVENSRMLASRIPNAELKLFDGVGHGFTGEVAEEVNRTVIEFLKTRGRPYRTS